MAFVEIPEEPPKRFLKMKNVFSKVGDTFKGVYVSDGEGTYGPEFTFSVDGCSGATLTIKGSLLGQLQKAKRDGHLKPGAAVKMQLAKFIPTKHENPARSFKFEVDPDYKGSPPKNGPNVSFDAPVAETEDTPF